MPSITPTNNNSMGYGSLILAENTDKIRRIAMINITRVKLSICKDRICKAAKKPATGNWEKLY